MRIVIDTNVVVSALFFGGKPREILDKVIAGILEAYATEEILDEYRYHRLSVGKVHWKNCT